MALTAPRIGDFLGELRRSPGAALTVLILPTSVFVIYDLIRIGDNTLSANFFFASVAVLSVVGAALNQMARGLAHDLSGYWPGHRPELEPNLEPNLKHERKDLPAGSLKDLIAARVVGTVVLSALAIAPLLIVALLISPVNLSVGVWLGLAVSIVIGAIPIMLYGLVLALWFGGRARSIATVSYFALALGGGLILPPQSMPLIIWRAAVILPSRHYGDVAWAPVLGWDLALGNWLWLAGFTVLFGGAALWRLRQENPVRI